MKYLKSIFPLSNIIFVTIISFSLPALADDRSDNPLKPPIPENKPPHPNFNKPPGISIQPAHKANSNKITERINDVVKQNKEQGFITVKDHYMSFMSIENVKPGFVPIDTVKDNVTSPLTVLPNLKGRLGNLSFEGAIPSHPDMVSSKWAQVKRFYSLPGKATLMLSEFDFVTARVSTTFPEELVNSEIMGFPAMFTTMKTPGGNVYTRLIWGSDKKLYQLLLTGHARGNGAENELIKLAIKIQEQEQ